jgi:glycosyltransferase involved in cell wall biosynthesis
MNLLFVTYQGDIAGSTQSIAYLAQGLAARGHNVYVGCRSESLLFRLLSHCGVHRIPMTFTGRLDLENMRQIKDAVRTYKIDIINAQSSYDRYTSIFARWLYKLPVRLVHTRRQMPLSSGGWFQNVFYMKGTDTIVAVSYEIQHALVERGIRPEQITVIYNGIPPGKYTRTFSPEKIAALRRQYSITPDDIVIGCVSRKKNQEQLLMALQHLDVKTKVLFVGIHAKEIDSRLLAPLRHRHEIIFCGVVPPDMVLDYYPLFTAHVLPSTIEGLSQTLLEAMAFGVPVIATRAAGNIDLIKDNWNGLLFEDKDPQDLAQKLKIIVHRKKNLPDLIQHAKKTATEDYAIDRTVTGYEQLFQQLIQSAPVPYAFQPSNI